MLHLKELRTQKGLTQSELSKALNVSASSIGMYEQGRREPDTTTLAEIAAYFNVTTDYLLGLPDNPHAGQSGKNFLEFADQSHAPTSTTAETQGGAEGMNEPHPQKKEYIELHRLIDQLSHGDVEELLNTARFKKNKAEQIREYVDDQDDF